MTDAVPTPLRIGITVPSRVDTSREGKLAKYEDAVRRAGGEPVRLSPSGLASGDLLSSVDAVVLTGGGDIHPKHYLRPPHAKTDKIDEPRDEAEIALVAEIVLDRIPALCICRGIQVLNVALGGTLHQHLPDVVGRKVDHDPERSYDPHPVDVVPGSLLAKTIGAKRCDGPSAHHQAIEAVAEGLEIVARADDQVIEAVEMPEHPFLLGVQWHPEQSAERDPAQQRLFDALVRAARARRESVGTS